MIKAFAHYLIESESTYDFKIKIAGIEMTDDVQDRIEHALQAFDLDKLSKPKHLPVTEKNLDFPAFGPVDVYLITASLKYPCTDEQLRNAIVTQARIPGSNVLVVPKNQPEELLRDEAELSSGEDETTTKKKDAILTKDLEKVSGGQLQVGMQRVESLLKELETRRLEFAAKSKEATPKTTNNLPQNNTSPVAKKAHSVKVR
jgi:hypothetical protein